MSERRPPAAPSVSIAVLSWNGRAHLEILLPALAAQRAPGVEAEVIVLDNGSWDGTEAWVRREHPEVRLVRSDVNLGFCAGNNRLAREARGDALILLNNDTRPRPDWLAALVDAYRRAPADVAALSGLLVDWDGARLDFGRGVLTFDGHAFQRGFGRPLGDAPRPADGEELLFACGGNMIVRRDVFLRHGGFDPDFFAYLEDVDLGWRLWAAGHRVLAAPEAVAHHRSMATSRLLGDANRGFLFERNAFLTAYRNFDAELWPRLAEAVWWTANHRVQTLLVQNNPGGELLTLDPYAGLIANTAAPTVAGPEVDLRAVEEPAAALDVPARLRGAGREGLRAKWRRHGTRELVRRGVRKAIRKALPPFVLDEGGPSTRIVDPRSFAHLRAQTWVLSHLDRLAARRAEIQARRERPDREIFERFPLAVVPTYPGDERLFSSAAFRAALPDDLVFEHVRLEDLIAA
ncbi:MAG: glycosyltransferase family 2 protein [Acidobacteriota bacterium]